MRPHATAQADHPPEEIVTFRILPNLLPAVVIAFSVLLSGPLSAQTIGGRLLDATSGEPIAGGSVLLVSAAGDTIRGATTGGDGGFALGAPAPGSYRLLGIRIGYQPSATSVTLSEGHRLVDIRLDPQAIQLETLEVRAEPTRRPGELGGFYDRQRRSIAGRFTSREQFEKYPHSRLSDIVSTFGVQVRSTPGGGMTLSTGQACLKLVIDGVRMPDRMMSHPDELVNADDIEGVEIYRNFVDVPGEFVGGFNQCGAIVVWTRYSR